ncbi:MAG: MAPEG family protein [Pseudomonadota bacterium]
MTMTTLILLTTLLCLLQTFLPPLFRYYLRPDPKIGAALGNRDAPVEASVYAGRAERALRNMMEAMLLFTPVALLATTQPGVDQDGAVFGALIFLAARAVYVPVYILGVAGLRSLVWTVGHVGVLLIALELL